MFKLVEYFLSLLETANVLADDELMESLKRDMNRTDDSQYSDIADVKARLGL